MEIPAWRYGNFAWRYGNSRDVFKPPKSGIPFFQVDTQAKI